SLFYFVKGDFLVNVEPCQLRYGKGQAFYSINNEPDEKAIVCYKETIKINPKHKEALLDLGFILSRQEKYEDALTFYDGALEIDSENTYTLNNKGFALYRLGKYKEVIACYDKVLQLDPGDITAINNKKLALVLARQNPL
ncbi:MAG TPA: tetratricopeptide repeat protein, partial [Candidatus Eremiobacteraeota bacterium]|nr:tetratricopeptide repeat protein [Candidatus Eremiobacteraeota bacterium]